MKTKNFKTLLQELSKDPRIKKVIGQAKARLKNENSLKALGVTDFLILLIAVFSKFLSKKKARILEDLIEPLLLLFQVSLILKENVFDRPEVREFFSKHSSKIYKTAREYVAKALAKTKKRTT